MSDDAGGTVRGLWLRRGGIAAAILLVGAVVGWAASAVFTPPQDVLDSTAYTFVEVVQGEVGSSIALNTVAEWTPIWLTSFVPSVMSNRTLSVPPQSERASS